MNCPKCGGDTVIRGTKCDCESVHRRRICVECGHVFFTSEYESDGKAFRELVRDYINSRYIKYIPKKIRGNTNDLS